MAVSQRMLPIADGSDLGGSLRNPAGWNNVFGLRPSQGRVPSWPRSDAFFAQLVTEGPIARSASDLALLLGVQSGEDLRAPLSLPTTPGPAHDALLDVDLRGRRIAWLADLGGHLPMEAGVLSVCEAALKVMTDAGLRVDAITPTFNWTRLWRCFVVLRQFSLGGDLAGAFADLAVRELMKPELQWELSEALELTVADVQRAAVTRTSWYDAVLALFEEFDYLALPSAQLFPFPIGETWPTTVAGRAMDSYHRWMEVVVPGTLSGCPVISVPAGFGGEHDLPIGLQVVGRPRDDLSLLQLARWWEQRAPWRRALSARSARADVVHCAAMSPVLAESHDRAHPVEADTAWSESYYFNCYDPDADVGFYTRVGVRPNEGTIDVGLAVWLPGGGIDHTGHRREQTEMVDSVLDVGPVRYEMLEPMKRWRLTADGKSLKGDLAMDVTFEALTPPIGADGQNREAADSSSARDAPVGRQGPPRAGRAAGRDGSRPAASARELGPNARGNRDKSWGPRRWGGPKMWRWFSINIDDDTHFGGIVIGTDAGDLHRGWVWRDGEHESIAEWKVTQRARGRRRDAPRDARRRHRQGRARARARRRAAPGRAGHDGHPAQHDDRQRGPRPLDLRGPHRHRHQRVPPPARRRRPARRPDHLTHSNTKPRGPDGSVRARSTVRECRWPARRSSHRARAPGPMAR